MYNIQIKIRTHWNLLGKKGAKDHSENQMWSGVRLYRINRMHLWWSLCTLYLHACQLRITAGDSGPRFCVCVSANKFPCVLIPLQHFWASFCSRSFICTTKTAGTVDTIFVFVWRLSSANKFPCVDSASALWASFCSRLFICTTKTVDTVDTVSGNTDMKGKVSVKSGLYLRSNVMPQQAMLVSMMSVFQLQVHTFTPKVFLQTSARCLLEAGAVQSLSWKQQQTLITHTVRQQTLITHTVRQQTLIMHTVRQSCKHLQRRITVAN